ncbi:general transcription factor II-I repeat domain-containing protein 2-like [Diabrotica undecimpunctata]|uniref:general transcription factor II-I repeat domain-containing protein 2-like n=1 Tax=Diabrotica undecimpunctata TaxID=50387 RepID=UPI003B637413
MTKAEGVVGAFIDKLSIFEKNMQRRDLTKFLNLKSSCGDSEDLQTYCLHLQKLKEDLQSRLEDLTSLKVPTWFINPFSVEVLTVCPSLQENLIDLKHDVEIESLFRECGYERF